MTRVVIDTNVFVSSFFGGNPRKMIDMWKSGLVVLCLSGPIIDEYTAVLKRMGIGDEQELDELLALFARGENVIFAAKTPVLKVVPLDPADTKFIECATALSADFVISGDKGLLAVNNYMGIKIVSPKKALELISK